MGKTIGLETLSEVGRELKEWYAGPQGRKIDYWIGAGTLDVEGIVFLMMKGLSAKTSNGVTAIARRTQVLPTYEEMILPQSQSPEDEGWYAIS